MHSHKKAQMSLIMILVVAIAMIFFAVSFNWTRIAGKKAQVTIASNQGAATLASQAASYGEYFLQTQMDGKLVQKDKTSAWWKWIAAGLLIIAAAAAVVATGGLSSGASAWAVSFAVSLIVSAASMTISAVTDSVSIQPGFSKAWGKAIGAISSTQGRFAEQGVQAMLQAVVNDSEETIDRLDMDMDGRWYLPADDGTGNAAGSWQGDPSAPKIQRFAYYNSKRLLQFPSSVPFGALQAVLKDMQKKLGLSQVVGNVCPRDENYKPLLPQCDPCCQEPLLRPEGCGSEFYLPQCARNNNYSCSQTSLYGCFVYDSEYERRGPIDPDKFMGVLGEDDPDAHRMGPDLQPEKFPPYQIPQNWLDENKGWTYDGGAFRGKDAIGKFFPMLWAFADSHAYVKDLGVNKQVLVTEPACHWRAKDGTGAPECALEFQSDYTDDQRLSHVYYRPPRSDDTYQQLQLTQGCSALDCYVNLFQNTLDPEPQGFDPGVSTGSARSRHFFSRINISSLFFLPLRDDQCSPPPPGKEDKNWKKGSDRLTQTFLAGSIFNVDIPASTTNDPTGQTVQPIKYMSGDSLELSTHCGDNGCACSEGDGMGLKTERWRDDPTDLAVKTMTEFTTMALWLVSRPEDSFQGMLTSTNAWGYPLEELTRQIDTMTTKMGVWLGDMNKWLAGDAQDYNYVGADLWCLPPQNNPSLTQTEKTAILAGGQWGSLGSVIACLEYNADNAQKFNNCYTYCGEACTDLPRSLLPGFEPDPTKLPQGGGFTEMRVKCEWAETCLAYAGLESCQSTPIEQLQAIYQQMLVDPTLYSGLDVAPFYSQLGEEQADIYDRLMVGDPTVTQYEIELLNDSLVNMICPEAMLTPIYHDECTTEATLPYQDSPYMATVRKSRDLAARQTPKFQKRAAYLSDLRTRVNNVKTAFSGARDYLTQPMSDPAVLDAVRFLGVAGTPTELIRAIIEKFRALMSGKQSGLGNDVIYGWFSKPPKGSTRAYGPLHLLRVQSSSPGYRQDLGQGTFPVVGKGAQDLPKITEDTNWSNTTRTYVLADNAGYVGARVIRYDEDAHSAMKFLSGLPIWKLSFRNPHEVAGIGEGLVEKIRNSCRTHYTRFTTSSGSLDYAPDPDSDKGELAEAFIFDLPMGSSPPPPLAECAGNVFNIMQRGMVSETCAYYWPNCKGEEGEHPITGQKAKYTDCNYDIKFVPCK